MASVALCPHCYLQLIVPEGIEHDARVACPSCDKEFAPPQAVLRVLPEVVVVARSQSDADSAIEDAPAEHAPLAAAIPQREAVAHAAYAAVRTIDDVMLPREGSESADDGADEYLDSNETFAESAPVVDDGPLGLQRSKSAATTLAELLPFGKTTGDATVEELQPVPTAAADSATGLSDAKPHGTVKGPTFDLPDVSLAYDHRATQDDDSEPSPASEARVDFELDDVDFEAPATCDDAPVGTPADAAATPVETPPVDQDSPPPEAAPKIVPLAGRRRRRSTTRTLIATGVGGAIGLALGYPLLLIILGPDGDFLDIAKHVPRSLLPDSFQAEAAQFVGTPAKPSQQPDGIESRAAAGEGPENVPAHFLRSDASGAEAATDRDGDDLQEGYGSASSIRESYSDKPSRFEEPPSAAPLAPAELRLSGGPSFTTDQLKAAFHEAAKTQPGLVAGDLGDPAVRRIKGLSYAKLCALAQALTFHEDRSTSGLAEQLERDAEQLFRETLSRAHTRGEVASIAAIWIDSPHRRHGGVFLAGTVSGGQVAGDVYEYDVRTSNGSVLAIVLPRPLDGHVDASGRPLGIVGTIVERPADRIPGYSGGTERVIWASQVIPLD